MQHNLQRPRQALNKAYLKQKPGRAEIEAFKQQLKQLLDALDLNESEENAKNHLRDFLKDSWYSNYEINTKEKTDLVIHTGNSKSPAGVLLEVKRPTNKAEMPTAENLNARAMQELLLYYLRERLLHHNQDLKQLIITNVHEWFIFDAHEFDRLFYRNTKLRKEFTDWEAKRKSGSTTDYFYKEIAAPAITAITEPVSFTHFNLKDYEKPLRNKDLKDDVKLVALYKLLSPAHLLKEPFANDANSLDRGFYQELLHLIGLEEVKEKGRKLIQRKENPDAASLLESAYQKLRTEDLISGLDNSYAYGNTREEQLFNVALELCITWMNRVLFLKLLEAQLISYHHGDRRYAFLSSKNLREFDDLNELFFDVLAEKPEKRSENVKQKYAHIPYLNSSLFETTHLEKRTLRISNLKDRSQLKLHPQTVLRNQHGKPLHKTQKELPTLQYLLDFLDSYDFGAEGKEDIQEENKKLMSASVLGLIFEKINGYRDGSFYTPSFITMYMARQALRRAVIQRFNDRYNWNAATFYDLQLQLSSNRTLEHVQEYNNIINNLRICDPAVGSGHFLVSALNELIAIKAELRLLLNRQGKPLHYGSIEVENDELIITDSYGELFSYTLNQRADGSRTVNPQVQELQETLFHEKQTIIENCLFGVDINPNSVKICRLRLWIELLKNAYYINLPLPQGKGRGEGENNSPVCYEGSTHLREGFSAANPDSNKLMALQTLPNIDINIKQGNSLLSRYPLDADLHEVFGKKKFSVQEYRQTVQQYKNTNSKEDKRRLLQFLDEIKDQFRTTLYNNDPLRVQMAKLRGQIAVMQDPDLFGSVNVDKKLLVQKKKKLQKLEQERQDIEENRIYEGAFEWRFEFPEVLDEEGNYRGFDVVLGNPPYIRQEELGDFKTILQKTFKTYAGTADLYVYFVEQGVELLNSGGYFSYIIPNKWMRAGYGQALRQWLKQHRLLQLVDFGDLPVFEEATTYPLVLQLQKTEPQPEYTFGAAVLETLDFETNLEKEVEKRGFEVAADLLPGSGWTLSNSAAQQLLEKLKQQGRPLGEYVQGKIFRGVLTGLNEAFVLDEATKNKLIAEDPKSAEIIKPFLAGRDVKRYQPPKSDKFLIFTRRGIDIEQYPAIKAHLEQYREKLEPKPKDFDGVKWLGRKQGPYKWFEVQDSIAYFLEFEKQKIVLAEIAKYNQFSIDLTNSYYDTTAFIIGDNDKFLLALLNSKLLLFYFKSISSEIRGGYLRWKRQYLQLLPIATATETEKTVIRELVEQILEQKRENPAAGTAALEAEIDLLVYRLYNLTEDEIALVEQQE